MKTLFLILFSFIVAFGQQANSNSQPLSVNGWSFFSSDNYDSEKTFSYLEGGGYQTFNIYGPTVINGSTYLVGNYSKSFHQIFSGGYTEILKYSGFRYKIKELIGKVEVVAINLEFQYESWYISDISCRETIVNPLVDNEWKETKFNMNEVKKSIINFDRATLKFWVVSSESSYVGASISIDDLYGEDSLGVRIVYDSFDINDVPVETLPSVYSLSQNYPNPFNPTTQINYSLEKAGMVSLKIYDILGRVVADLVNRHQDTGSYTVDFNASNLSTGVYFYKLESGSFSDTKKFVLLK